MDDPEAAAESVTDLRIQRPLREHQAWFSCDALGVDWATPAEEISDWYRRIAKLFVELLDENCLLVYLPDAGRLYAINDETQQALRSDDPLAALQKTQTVPMISVQDDDPRMQEAVLKAQDTWPEFVAAFEANRGKLFSIKAPVSHSGKTEFIWVQVTAVEGDHVYGKLANDPANLGPLKVGSKVKVPLSDLNDWCYIDAQGNLQGGFTIPAVQRASLRPRDR
jgi:uncharacterized protein YegJ (DUF2314 family)